MAARCWWRVGDGRSIKIWENQWIPNGTGGKPISTKPVNCPINKVFDFIDQPGSCWNRQLVEQFFLPHEAAVIMKIPLKKYPNRDQLIWSKEGKGLFTVRSAYRLAYSYRKEHVAS